MTPEKCLNLFADRIHLQPEDVKYILGLFDQVRETERSRCVAIASPQLTVLQVADDCDSESFRLGVEWAAADIQRRIKDAG